MVSIIVINVLGTDDRLTQSQSQAIKEEVGSLLKDEKKEIGKPHVYFPVDRIEIDLGEEIVVQVFGLSPDLPEEEFLAGCIREIVRKHLSNARSVDVQMIDACTVFRSKK